MFAGGTARQQPRARFGFARRETVAAIPEARGVVMGDRAPQGKLIS